ncbi:MAG: valine--tRNA ligase [Candidatus Zambryskibacteria bacterium RIFCSPLOWO2_01_FULL_39_39]|uniref:Valine--tRNA ligase n=1 Tax=Candidatus Zambryskibacteria bacterium RIFCSPLOWO2_01_FULL_39_39 TaxID=1802758 RepID=A0A1G2TYM4_9BACT|nr:MAG: valyl-tRNA synthetase [Parcubacteria group bacterium GW2011_GWA1_38_7]OHA87324.1 MAG: valine--tRNA ligase [Candidatus Zambryskibacteria bacterium RIFCSPHIGHO2_01_FULL_39_63]OHA95299.1 MAG: valine--tRNA ligase [Candidatus Zambryskibacteria bacterium RIFCSPHIGHO2_02_FULL_39_19]OHA98877.1 MAG: valine--tRNA ligase [Candidatus Zambryskibacteria bacterium RIFCSPHIGHO2_12_FULL_39_21]OHB01730.1 MAG: valine--tRNA ligase [Candidatus Zambryskibacteria bacterium RIFCSPLOWO2_01_FULL_39_39]
MSEELKKPYNPTEHEESIYRKWEESGFFNPDVCVEKGVTDKNADYFSIVLPPPNVTGTLHMGSAFMLAIEDVIVRFNRMWGKKTLWIPGTDHAAIATQSKVEKLIQKEGGKNRHDLGREEFLKRVEKFAKENHDIIIHQMKKMGCSLDWSREAFTLDEKRNLAVKTVFKKMYDDGIIYRGHRIVNWDPKGQTTISDDEIVYQEQKTKFYYLQYGPFVIGTTRPETKFGDKYVVMHPDDKRYASYKDGQKIDLEWINGPITATIIKDESIDMEFGTGVMTITPWHSVVDFEIAERHNLDKEQIIDKYGRLLPVAGEFSEMKIVEAREKIIEKLKKKSLVLKEEDYTNNVATAERTGGFIEPQIMNQWFIDVNKEFTYIFDTLPNIKKGEKVTLKKLMLSVVENKNVNIIPDRFEKEYTHWIENLRDWCISRQIWYGHRIPVWYRSTNTHNRSNEEIYCGIEAPKEIDPDSVKTTAGEWVQDGDTLDTWFSSGLWTFSTLGWPEKTEDLKNYHPTTVLETGYDILFFWVARMILMSTYTIGQIPFTYVYLHGMVRDNQGRKISKSLGNNIDPLEMLAKYSADGVRMALLVGTGPGGDSKISEEKLKAYKHFANKIWNASRFVLENVGNMSRFNLDILVEKDKEILKEFKDFTSDITADMENYRFHLAAEKIYHYFWHTFADIIIEDCKKTLRQTQDKEVESAKQLLYYLLTEQLKLLHPFMPFITEKIWSMLPDSKGLLMVEKWPTN